MWFQQWGDDYALSDNNHNNNYRGNNNDNYNNERFSTMQHNASNILVTCV